MRPHHVAIAAVLLGNFLPSAALTQARPALTADDYARGERALGPTVGRLVSGIPGRPIWLPDGRATYRVSPPTGGGQFVIVDPRRGTRAAAFDHARLAEAVSAALGQRVTGDSLPFSSLVSWLVASLSSKAGSVGGAVSPTIAARRPRASARHRRPIR